MGVRGWLTAVDEDTGQNSLACIFDRAGFRSVDWRLISTRTTVGSRARTSGSKVGHLTSGRSAAAGVWGWISYDPGSQSHLLRHGKSGSLEPRSHGPATTCGSSSLFARDTGHRQRQMGQFRSEPHDLWDYDEINENILIDLPINNRVRKVLVHPGRNGLHVCDRPNHRRGLVGRSVRYREHHQKSIDLKPGRPVLNGRELTPKLGKTVKDVCPACAWREGLAARRRSVAAHQAALRSASAPLHELPDQTRSATSRVRPMSAATVTCLRALVETGAEPVTWDPLRAQESLVHHREAAGLDRRAGDGW